MVVAASIAASSGTGGTIDSSDLAREGLKAMGLEALCEAVVPEDTFSKVEYYEEEPIECPSVVKDNSPQTVNVKSYNDTENYNSYGEDKNNFTQKSYYPSAETSNKEEGPSTVSGKSLSDPSNYKKNASKNWFQKLF